MSQLLGAGNAELQASDADDFVRGTSQTFDIVFLDPPFANDGLAEICRLIDENGLLAPGATVYLEQDEAGDVPDLPAGWQITKNKTAGNVRYMLATCPNVENDT